MAWKEMSMETLAKSLGANLAEVREKQRLIDLIIKARKTQRLSQTALASRIGVTQSRIAQIESGVGTSKVSFDILLNILVELGYEFRVVAKKGQTPTAVIPPKRCGREEPECRAANFSKSTTRR